MARIYALAKELNLDSKDLVDIVKKVGITGKGSALASLSDDEVQRVRDHLAGFGSTRRKADNLLNPTTQAVRESIQPDRKPVAIPPVKAGSAKPGDGKAGDSEKDQGGKANGQGRSTRSRFCTTATRRRGSSANNAGTQGPST